MTSADDRRAIVYIDHINANIDHDDEKPWTDGWEIHVRCPDGSIDHLIAARDSHTGGWNLRCAGECWGVFKELGDAFMHALEPMDAE